MPLPPAVLTPAQRLLRIFLPFALGYYLSYLLRTVNAVISPELTNELGLSASSLGLLTSAYFFAFALAQLPVGILLDRYGPRRVESALLLVTAAGCLLFATAASLPTLVLARGLIGLGVSSCLMAGLKGFSLWYAPERQASMIGFIMACGALGAVTASMPLEHALPLIGWRGAFLSLAALAAGSAALIRFGMPERGPNAGAVSLRQALQGLGEVFSASRFWLFSGQAAFFTGGFMALQGLWAVPWLMHVNGYSRADAAGHLLWLNLGMLGGQLAIGALAWRLARHGITPVRLMQAGLLLTLLLEAAMVMELAPTRLLWCALGVATASGAQMYGVVARQFAPALSGRVTTAINLIAFVGAFGVQWGLGGLLDGLQAAGIDTPGALRTAFLILIALQLASYLPLLRASEAPAVIPRPDPRPGASADRAAS